MFKKIALLSFTAILVLMLIPAAVLKAAGEYEGPAIQIGDTVPSPTTIPDDGKIVMPDVMGLYYEDARNQVVTTLRAAGFSANIQVEIGWVDNSDPDKTGKILSQDPVAGSELDKNTDIVIYLYAGEQGIALPDPTVTAIPTTAAIPTIATDPTVAANPTTAAANPTAAPGPANTAEPTTATEPTNGNSINAPQVSLMLDKDSASVVCGKNTSVKATLRESTAPITWKSSNNKVATVDSKGKITARMAGQATITASAAGKSADCVVTVLYKDVTSSKDFWYKPTNYLTAEGVVKGYDNQTMFKPANQCTRAQMVTFIWRLAGEPKPETDTCKFSDVKKTDYFYNACIWGNEKHIVEGYNDGTFGPQIVCARRHAVTFLWRLAGKPNPTSKTNKFTDVKKDDYFYTATLWASEKGILAGYDDNTFRPDGDYLRRQMVTFLYKYDKFVNKK